MVGNKDYGFLKDVEVKFKDGDGINGVFSLCFWFYLNEASTFPSTILYQEHPDGTSHVPFLLLDEKKRVLLFPTLLSSHSNATSWRDVPYATSRSEFPTKKWVHIGCEVTLDLLRLYLDGEIVGENFLTSSVDNDRGSTSSNKISLSCIRGNDIQLDGYVHSAELLSLASSIRNHYVKDPPVLLSIDSSSTSEIEEESDGVWSIVGGKASCRRNFSLDVTLKDNFGLPVTKEVEVVASLVYADNEAPVEKPVDAEAPLLTSYDGIEFASSDRPSKVISGRASFKLKISQLSSKCDNRLFCIKFEIPKMGKYPFLEALSTPIRCISRNRSTRTTSLPLKKSSSGINLLNGPQSPAWEDACLSAEFLPNIVREANQIPSSKRVKLGLEKPLAVSKDDFVLKQAHCEPKSHSWTTEDNYANGNTLVARPLSHGGAENISSDSEDSETTKSVQDDLPNSRGPISDLVVFKYCLSDLNERALLLKEIAMRAREEELESFAERVSLFSGCSHHRHQISISKRLIEEGIKCWDLISNYNNHVLWENLVSGLQEHFMKMTFGFTRSLTYQDFDLLRSISGCQDVVSQENFEKMWCWLYPVVFTLSHQRIASLWGSVSPMWIEGFITKEEAESSLRGQGGLQEPGTFVLRFPTSRSWPHPDAGNLVATYVGSDYSIHNRLVSLDFLYSSGDKGMTVKDMLLEQPELCRLGRVVRSQ